MSHDHLTVADVLDADGNVRSEIRLDAVQTKGKHARTVFVGERLRKELASYLTAIAPLRAQLDAEIADILDRAGVVQSGTRFKLELALIKKKTPEVEAMKKDIEDILAKFNF